MNDVMFSGMGDNLCRFLTKEEMREKAPFIFADKATNPNVSDRYVFASTETIVDDLEKLGWGVVDCKQQRANKKGGIRSLHMLAFQNPNIYITKTNENNEETIEAFPRIILQSSHDGFHSFKFMVGLFRTICSNGLIVATEQFADINIRHINYTFEELRGIVAKAIEAVTANIDIMNDMQSTTLDNNQKYELANKALRIRHKVKDDEKFTASNEEIEDLLTPLRKEDEGDTLWNVFNVLQEKIIKGNFLMNKPNGKKRKARAIKGIERDMEINQNLFRTATSYIAAAA